MSSNERRRPSGRRRLPAVVAGLVLSTGFALSACGPAPTPPASGAVASASPDTSPSPIVAPSLLAVPPDERLVVLVDQHPLPEILTWLGKGSIALPPPRPGLRDLAIGPDGRVAILAEDGIFIADALADDARWAAVPELRPPRDHLVTGLAWSPDGKLAWAAARELGVSPFTVAAGSPGEVPARVEVDAGLDGGPAWLDTKRIAVPVVRDPLGGLIIVSLAGDGTPFEPIPAGVLAVASRAGLVALGDRHAARIEIRRIEDLTASGGPPLAVIEEADAAVAVDLAFSVDGRWLAAAWTADDGSLLAIGVYDGDGGWIEGGRLDRAALKADPDARVRLAWRP
ncbi:MAG TPA: hypothetical protein VNO86_11650 [Candidatus Binatia bacterium]|nr:hypothetical protein [Candidatus Binatia bacterium]